MGDNNTTRPKRRWVSPVKELGCSSQRMRDGSQQSAEIAVEQVLGPFASVYVPVSAGA
jgi:hypothetical protein